MNNQDTKIVWVMELASPDDFRPKEAAIANMEIRQVEIDVPEFNWFLHQAVGTDYRWGGREDWTADQWSEYIKRPGMETWVAWISGSPAGYYELQKMEDTSVEIHCFGLLPSFIGKGIGGPLLTAAVQRGWDVGANKVWLRTCSHDHPNAVTNYEARGFRVTDEMRGPPNRERQSVIFTT